MASQALIMAGGEEIQLQPLSRRDRPKQSLELIGERTMFEHAVDRIAPVFQPEKIFVVAGPHVGIDTHDTLVFSKGDRRLVATIGLEGMVVVDTEDALLVCPKELEQEVREIVHLLESEDRGEHL